MPVLFSTIIYRMMIDLYDDFYDFYFGDLHLGHSHSRIGEEGTKGKAGEHCDCRCYVLHMGKVFFDWYKMWRNVNWFEESPNVLQHPVQMSNLKMIWEILKCVLKAAHQVPNRCSLLVLEHKTIHSDGCFFNIFLNIFQYFARYFFNILLNIFFWLLLQYFAQYFLLAASSILLAAQYFGHKYPAGCSILWFLRAS